MNTQREVVVKTIVRFHQFPFWNPYTCGGHPAWGSLESDPIARLAVASRVPARAAADRDPRRDRRSGASGVRWAAGCSRRASRAALALRALAGHRGGGQQPLGACRSPRATRGTCSTALLPWALYFFDRAIDAGAPAARARGATSSLAAACIAAMVYGDAIYPRPAHRVRCSRLRRRGRRAIDPLLAADPRARSTAGVLAVGLVRAEAPAAVRALRALTRASSSPTRRSGPQDLVKILTWREGDYPATALVHVRACGTSGGSTWAGSRSSRSSSSCVVASRGPRERALKWAGFVDVHLRHRRASTR